jgi:hypothetical protein
VEYPLCINFDDSVDILCLSGIANILPNHHSHKENDDVKQPTFFLSEFTIFPAKKIFWGTSIMPIQDDITWFKDQFKEDIQTAIDGTPFRIELIIAIALQETGYLWRNIYKKETVAKTLELCVGDTLSASEGRTAFPKDKSALESKPKGQEMFTIAREALEAIAEYNNAYKRAARNPDRFCHGFGIFQYDLQFFLDNQNFFLQKKWYEFDECLKLCVDELKVKLITT